MNDNLALQQCEAQKLTAYGYRIELHGLYVFIYDEKGTLERAGAEKLAEWVVSEGFCEKPFEVKVFNRN